MALPINPSQINFTLPTLNADGTTLDPATIADVEIEIGIASGGPYTTKTIRDKNLTPDSTGFCHYPTSGLGLPAGTYYMVLVTELTTGVQSAPSTEVGFTLSPIPNPPGAVSVS